MVTVAVLEISCSMAVMSRLPLLVLLTKTTTTNTVGSVLCDTGYFFCFDILRPKFWRCGALEGLVLRTFVGLGNDGFRVCDARIWQSPEPSY